MLIDVTKKKPHYYFENQIYFKLTIRNRTGETNFTREIRGNNEQLSHDEIDFSVGDRIEIYHAEPNRLTVSPFYPELINAGAYTNILIIDKFGLINNDTMNDPEQHLIKRIEKEAKFLRASPELYIKENSPFKDDMYLAIDILEESSRWKYLMDYQDCISTNNTPLDYFDGDHFTITAKGIYDFQFLTASIDLNKQTVTIELERGIAHHYFSQIYASLVYEDVKGNVLYKLEIIGNKKQEMQSVKLPISGNGGEVIRIFHEEAVTRLEITNDSKKEKLKEQGKQQNYCLTTKGLKRFTD